MTVLDQKPQDILAQYSAIWDSQEKETKSLESLALDEKHQRLSSHPFRREWKLDHNPEDYPLKVPSKTDLNSQDHSASKSTSICSQEDVNTEVVAQKSKSLFDSLIQLQ